MDEDERANADTVGDPLPPVHAVDPSVDRNIRDHVKAALFGGTPPADRDRTGMPTQVGRFRITKRLGSGGMGEVLAGFDDELERPVAVKLLHREIGAQHRDRLRREAKALAQLSHPNVVQVYEVGTWRKQVFVAMELVEGSTLRSWLAAQTRSLDEILRVFVEAGTGLAAAHKRDLIHRDFKPDNVIVGREEERPRVLDFGLARKDPGESVGSAEVGAEVDARSNVAMLETQVQVDSGKLSDSLTRTGTILGTPAYMAPEQFRGDPTAAATDQFSYCVTLWEALYGKRPFAAGNVRALMVAVCESDPARPQPLRGPARLHRALVRGLAKSPQGRWPSMEALIAELAAIRAAPVRRRRSILAVGGLGLVGATAAWAAAGDDDRCGSVEDRFAGIWDEATKETVRARYADGPLRARQWWATEERLLDGWVADWSRIYKQSCEGGERHDAPQLFEQRQTCLDQRLNEIQIRSTAMRELDPGARASAAWGDYLPFYLPHECGNDTLVRAIVAYPSDPDQRQALRDAYVEDRLSEVRAQAAGFGDPSLDYGQTLEERWNPYERAIGIDYGPVVAESKARMGAGLWVSGSDPVRGLELLEDAADLALAARVELLYVFAEVWRLEFGFYQDGSRLRDPAILGEFERWERALERVGSPAAGMIELLDVVALHHTLNGNREQALAAIDRGLEVATEAYGANSVFGVRAYNTPFTILSGSPLADEAPRYRDALVSAIDRTLGPDSIHLFSPYLSQFDDALTAGRIDDALSDSRDLMRLAELHYGDGGLRVVGARLAHAKVQLARGEVTVVMEILDDAFARSELDAGHRNEATELQAAVTAVRGVVDEAAAQRLTTSETKSPFTQTIVGLTVPLADGRPAAKALAAVDERLQGAEPGPLRAVGALVRGRLLQRLGRHAEAAAAYAEVAACRCTSGFGRGLMQAGAIGRVEALRADSDPRLAQAHSEAADRLRSARADHPLLTELGPAPARMSD